jgi:hypothetical protein
MRLSARRWPGSTATAPPIWPSRYAGGPFGVCLEMGGHRAPSAQAAVQDSPARGTACDHSSQALWRPHSPALVPLRVADGPAPAPCSSAAGCIAYSAHSEPSSPGESMISPSMSRRIVRALAAAARSPPSPRSICSRYNSAARGISASTRAFSRSVGGVHFPRHLLHALGSQQITANTAENNPLDGIKAHANVVGTRPAVPVTAAGVASGVRYEVVILTSQYTTFRRASVWKMLQNEPQSVAKPAQSQRSQAHQLHIAAQSSCIPRRCTAKRYRGLLNSISQVD